MRFDEEYYKKLSRIAIKKLLNGKQLEGHGGKKEIAIYPFGRNGQVFKAVLNDEFGVTEKLLVDNRIKPLAELSDEERENCIFVITSDNEKIFEEIRVELRKYVSEENCFDIFDKVVRNRDTRIETLRLNAERINQYGIEGNVAEVGVWKGRFAKYINKYFKGRKLYLFDTFEGFTNQQVAKEVDERWKNELDSIEENFDNPEWMHILDDFEYPEDCIIKKGYFPDTAEGIEDTFCFVSLDVDIYAGTISGLEFFWPKLENGGMIMIHDYNCNSCQGVTKAVNEFAKKRGIFPVCLSDRAGSAILLKQIEG